MSARFGSLAMPKRPASGMSTRVVALAAALLLTAALDPASAQEALNVPGTTVSLVPPEDYEPAADHAGFHDGWQIGRIVVAELPPRPHPETAATFESVEGARRTFEADGFQAGEAEELTTAAGLRISVLSGVQEAAGLTFNRWIALFEGERKVMVTVVSPQDTGLDAEEVREMLRSVELGPEATAQQKLDALPFEVSVPEGFRVVETFGGSSLVLAAGEFDTDPAGLEPAVFVSYRTSPPLGVSVPQDLGLLLLMLTPKLARAEVESEDAVEFAGGEGLLMSGTARDDGTTRRFVQYLTVKGEDGYASLLAVAGEDRFEEIEEAVREIAASVAVKDRAGAARPAREGQER